MVSVVSSFALFASAITLGKTALAAKTLKNKPVKLAIIKASR